MLDFLLFEDNDVIEAPDIILPQARGILSVALSVYLKGTGQVKLCVRKTGLSPGEAQKPR